MPLGSINVDSKRSDLGKVGQHCVLDVSNCLEIFKRTNTFLSQRYAKDKFLVTSHYGKYYYKMSQLGVLDIFFINSHMAKKLRDTLCWA